jgi:hypothetical protein
LRRLVNPRRKGWRNCNARYAGDDIAAWPGDQVKSDPRHPVWYSTEQAARPWEMLHATRGLEAVTGSGGRNRKDPAQELHRAGSIGEAPSSPKRRRTGATVVDEREDSTSLPADQGILAAGPGALVLNVTVGARKNSVLNPADCKASRVGRLARWCPPAKRATIGQRCPFPLLQIPRQLLVRIIGIEPTTILR